jgi:hypothetical protein
MARYKLASKNPKRSAKRGLIPCALLIIAGIVLMSALFYAMLKSAAN